MLQLAAASLAKTGKSFQHTTVRAILLGEKCIDDCPKTQFFSICPWKITAAYRLNSSAHVACPVRESSLKKTQLSARAKLIVL